MHAQETVQKARNVWLLVNGVTGASALNVTTLAEHAELWFTPELAIHPIALVCKFSVPCTLLKFLPCFSGESTRTEPCAFTPCTYPNDSCCSGRSAGTYNGQILCGPLPEYEEPAPIQMCVTPQTTPAITTTTTPACTPGGEWSAWSAGTCNDTCGLCGSTVSTRTCLSEASGCPCDGSTESVGAYCGDTLCTYPRTSCCSWAVRALVSKTIKCVLK